MLNIYTPLCRSPGIALLISYFTGAVNFLYACRVIQHSGESQSSAEDLRDTPLKDGGCPGLFFFPGPSIKDRRW
jgi:hypothetical protein